MIYASGKSLKLRIFLIVLIDALTVLITSEWMIFGIPIMLGFYIFREKPKARTIWFISVMFIMNVVDFVSYHFFMGNSLSDSAAAALTDFAFNILAYIAVSKLYNGKKGKYPVFSKWLFYIWYPAHLLIIYLLKYIV